ncbi:MAG TPA: M56 family metallopeptidase [Pyrinomonadaceae bacterium]|nr:M56 family metallopeptidase [Pyrinomonadaceae bacterium]
MKTSELLLTFLLNAIWQIPLIASAAAVGVWLLNQSSAKYRHWVWVAALLLSLLVPSVATSRLGLNNEPASVARENIPIGQWTAVDVSPEPFTAARTTARQSAGPFLLNPLVAQAIIAVYVAFLVFGLIRLFRAWRGTRRITDSGRHAEASEVLDAVLAKCQHLIGQKNVQILCSDSLPIPVTLGLRKPLIILPAKLIHEGNVELLTSAIAHEFVHVNRRDYVLNLFYELVFVLLSFHPVAALLRRRIKQTRELLCDELVADRVLEPDVYARSLVTLASAAPPLSRLSVNATVGIADADILEVRVMSLMNKSKLYPRSRKLVLIGVVLLLAVPSVTAMALAMRFDVDPFGSAVTQEQETKQKEREKEKERLDRQSVEYRDGLRAGQKEAQRRKEPFTSEDEARLKRQMEELQSKDQATPEDKLKLARLLRELEERAVAYTYLYEDEARTARQMEELKARDTRNAALVRLARIPMDQAIQIAISQQPGKVLESSLQAERWEEPGKLAKDGFVFYHISILSGDENSPTINHVWVNAIDGTIIRNEKELPRKAREPFREP